jgi:hypothetical protein
MSEINVGFWRWSVKENLLKFDDFVTDLFGFERDRSITREHFLDKVKIVAGETLTSKVIQTLAARRSFFGEYVVEVENKRLKFYVFGFPVFGNDGEVLALQGDCELVTESALLPVVGVKAIG